MSVPVTSALATIGVIAARFAVPVHRVRLSIERLKIQPRGWAGHARVFADAEVERIGADLRRLELRKRELERVGVDHA